MSNATRGGLWRLGAGALVAVALTSIAAALIACGPFLTDLLTVQSIRPANREAYARGNVGIVRPRFARQYLVEAYRRFSDLPPLRNTVGPTTGTAALLQDPLALEAWLELAETVLIRQPGTDPAMRGGLHQSRRIRDFQSIENCHDSAFANARDTLKARVARFGQSSPEVRAWTRAQVAVFSNCSGEGLVLPEPPPSSVDPVIRADSAYQTAAAYFYATQYEEADRRFRAIAADDTSPWRKYGRYLAARSAIRMATVTLDDPAQRAQRLAVAERDLKAVLDDATAASLHDSARGLLDYVAARLRPIDRLHGLSRALTASGTPSDQALVDFQRLMDRFVGDTVDYTYDSIDNRVELVRDDDLVDWILAMQGSGDTALARAIARWKETGAAPWLVAALWKLPPAHPDAAAVMTAAEAVDRSAPAFDTVAFLRVRVLIAQGRRDDARRLLGTLPMSASSATLPETVNLLKAERFLLAGTLDELLANAPRTIVVEQVESTSYGKRPAPRSAKDAPGSPAFDVDAAIVLSKRLPLDRLVTAAASSTLPDRLRVRVAGTAFARAVLLGRDTAGIAVTPHLKALAPHLARDLDAYATAADTDSRHRAAVMLLLRTPGMHLSVQGIDDNVTFELGEPARQFDHMFRRNWWCRVDAGVESRFAGGSSDSAALALLYEGGDVPFPEFVGPAERATTEEELKRLSALPPGPDYLASEALAWARARPADPDAAEALALVVEGSRWTCEGAKDATLTRRAFQTLHRVFPQSKWAKQTKYWYP